MSSVLLVDHDVKTADALIPALESMGKAVHWAKSGLSGLMVGLRYVHDVLIVGQKLKDMNGADLVKKIRPLAPETVPIVMVGTGAADDPQLAHLGVHGVLHKPLEMAAVTALIDSGLRERAAKRKDFESILNDILGVSLRERLVESGVEFPARRNLSPSGPLSMVNRYGGVPSAQFVRCVQRGVGIAREKILSDPASRNFFMAIVNELDRIRTVNAEVVRRDKLFAAVDELLDLGKIVEESYEALAPYCRLKGIQVKSRTSGERIFVRASRPHLSLVMKNLVLNAVQAMDLAPVKLLELDMGVGGGKKRFGYVSVSDTGFGMPAEMKNKLFTPGKAKKAAGGGKGLVTVHKIARNYGMELDCSSTLGEGTEVLVKFPLL